MENQDSPPLDPSLAPALLFELPGHGGAEAGVETKTTADDTCRFLYSIPKRRLLLARGFDYLNSDTTWITPQGWVLVLDAITRDASLRDPLHLPHGAPALRSGEPPPKQRTHEVLLVDAPAGRRRPWWLHCASGPPRGPRSVVL